MRLFATLLGPPETFRLEHRMLNAAALSMTVACALAPPVYLSATRHAGLLSALAGGLGLLQGVCYYLSRVRRVTAVAVPASLAAIAFGAIFYALTSGVSGSALYVFGVVLAGAVVMLEGTGRVIVAAAAIVTPLALLGAEYANPDWVGAVYATREARFLYIGLTYAGSLAALLTLSVILVRAYREAMASLEEESARSERLLDNVLPRSVSDRLKAAPGAIADGLEEVTVLFADLVGFTARTATMAPAQVVAMLNEIFSTFDTLSQRHGLEKVKTIGDAYMVVAGAPVARADHAAAAAEMALDMLAAMRASPAIPRELRLRIGLHSGPVVAGVIGTRKLFYDVWGDTVNTASRMESHGEPDRIQVTRCTHDLLASGFRLTRRGLIDVKGKGELETFFLDARAR